MLFELSIRVSVLLSAFLMFLIQPMIAKMILPNFGGSAFVWGTCIFFFQTALLLGYGYAYLLSQLIQQRIQVYLHLILLGLSLCFMPITIMQHELFLRVYPPLQVFLTLGMSVMLPVTLISATNPLLQYWYSSLKYTEFPHKYYSISNIGALLGLVVYPFLFEPFSPTSWQVKTYSILYGAYLVSISVTALYFYQAERLVQYDKKSDYHVYYHPIKWVLLTCLSSALLISITQFLTENVLNLPLLWVVPLALFLISYVITFSSSRDYQATFWVPACIIFVLLAFMPFELKIKDGIDMVIVHLAVLFSACMVCHGELIKLKPSNSKLTVFYLYIALGGVLGGIFVNFIAPYIFNRREDFYILILIAFCLSLTFQFKFYYKAKKGWDLFLGLCGLFSIAYIGYVFFVYDAPYVYKTSQYYRSPYGVLKVEKLQFNNEAKEKVKALFHGIIVHGVQFEAPQKQGIATTYYSKASGLYEGISFVRQYHPLLHVGAIGLGIGTLAAYGLPGDQFRFYEINHQVIDIARNQFNFISQSKAMTTTVLGDARISLSAELNYKKNNFNLIVVDAFNGDAIPYHLLTREALALYQGHLTKDGMIAFHITNTYVDLIPIIKGLANSIQCPVHFLYNEGNEDLMQLRSMWALLSCHPAFDAWIQKYASNEFSTSDRSILWTDDQNSIIPILNY